MNTQTAVFGGGCFWCTEAILQNLKGIISVEPGYTGGNVKNPTYEQVSNGKTGHAEVVRFEYDPSQITYKDLLNVFFATHNPTTLNRQGNDVGEQYRSVIFYADEDQKNQAETFINHLENEGIFEDDIVTSVEPLKEFYPAEDYHQRFYERNQGHPYCQVVINPKLRKLKEKFASLIKI